VPLDREAAGVSTLDVLDRLLDKGIVIDEWLRLSPLGIDLTTDQKRLLIARAGMDVNQIPRGTSLEDQLTEARRRLEHRKFEQPQPKRRAEDRIREELHDARARTIQSE